MTTFCLLHSSGQGPDGWRLLTGCLEQRGHHTITPAFRVSETDRGARVGTQKRLSKNFVGLGISRWRLFASPIPLPECFCPCSRISGRRDR